ncbi:ABC transporter permease [Aromatoleum bremense]|uniref:Transport permease protein n=1 Tax=Aromatoleum bremense TaxID=76115 RepID=A0ABX1NWF4_9RHOO|nr:ABC transporter permease [Aromatoleum bremense]NMG16350.1 ABC transporter permease [Aromatoleum bremense]QTQ32652.1 ABC-2 type transporter [Aromatoleum bremense]
MIQNISSAWTYRGFILSSILNELRIRFAGSRLGGLWMLLHPLIEVLMYALVLSSLMSTRLAGIDNRFSYAIYLTAGILAWTLFSETVNRCLNVFVSNAHLLKKIAFPAICLPLIVSGSALTNNLLLLVAITFIFGLVGHFPGTEFLFLPLLVMTTVVFGLGLGLILGTLNVFMRDVGQIVPVILQFGFWLTPIVYPEQTIPEAYRWLFVLNPMYHLSSAYQSILVFHQMPSFTGVSAVLVLGIGLLMLSMSLYRRAKPEIVDML